MSSSLTELEKFVPAGTAPRLLEMLSSKGALLKITKHRQSKFGDYRSPQNGKPHQITVNGTLNQYAFLLTFLHEYAHLQVHDLFGNRVKPHGGEWKTAFALLINQEIENSSFHPNLLPFLRAYAQNPKASTFSDSKLYRALEEFNVDRKSSPRLEDLETGAVFQLGKRVFSKGELRRTRVMCKELNSGRIYLVHRNAEVRPLDLSKQ